MTILTDNITSIHGDIGEKWFGYLDSIVADLAKKVRAAHAFIPKE
ncbi:hypothetical protein FACS189449_06250 [Alphaproteobacteria bacterium]|nr:hypothetical protein FACS189449_06250 [Alphaproteobacteria bacterium]